MHGRRLTMAMRADSSVGHSLGHNTRTRSLVFMNGLARLGLISGAKHWRLDVGDWVWYSQGIRKRNLPLQEANEPPTRTAIS